MKITLTLITACLFGFFSSPSHAREQLRKLSFPSNLKEINITGQSKISYTDAMNRLSIMTPDGYAIASVKYVKTKDVYIVIAKLVKI